jgi:hypothetical protein
MESADAVSVTGKAAHIHAASPGGRRYLASMSSEARMDISNAIWLCAHHADLIDKDETTYTAELLQAMKREHEARCDERHRHAMSTGNADCDLIAVGPDIVFCGDLVEARGSSWSLHLQNFVEGDLHALLRYIDQFERMSAIDRDVLVNQLGDGRVLSGAPTFSKQPAGSYVVSCPVLPSFSRWDAASLPADIALTEDHDFAIENGDLATVSGLKALPQKIKTSLSLQKGESPFHEDFGTRFAEYFRLFYGSPWFDQLLKLETIRQAAIPYHDPLDNLQYTPLLCVERVFGIKVLAEAPNNNWLPVRVDFEVKGVGRWQHELSICVPESVAERPGLKELLAGPISQT